MGYLATAGSSENPDDGQARGSQGGAIHRLALSLLLLLLLSLFWYLCLLSLSSSMIIIIIVRTEPSTGCDGTLDCEEVFEFTIDY